ncbi:MAG TPA: indole-3-glycerol-phosphate synthase [Steroidobacteraceae bacterium]|nr:indole-3-glycerol-phosphate synthase [Steroidobacteraceae bacterium]
MSGFLREMAQSSLERLTQARKVESESSLWLRASETPPAPPLKLSERGFDCFAELKLRSPAAGALSTANEDLCARVQAYAEGGAAAVSVLTEPYRFGGSMAHLARASQVLAPLGVPTMRKDFLIDPYQVMEARALGAGGVLVILRMLDHGRITELLDCAAMLHMFVLLEAFDEQDIDCANTLVAERAARVEQLLLGINSRDLDTLHVVPERLTQLAQNLTVKVPRVAESGVGAPDDAVLMAKAGYQVVLVGSALMTNPAPRQLLEDLIAAGRNAK